MGVHAIDTKDRESVQGLNLRRSGLSVRVFKNEVTAKIIRLSTD